MTSLKKITHTTALILILATGWFPLAQLSRMDTSIYLPNGIRLLIAALGLLCLKLVLHKELPHFSLRIINASLAAGVLGYFVPLTIVYSLIRTFPSGAFPILTAFIPVWCILFWPVGTWARGAYYFGFVAVQIMGFALFISGLRGGDPFTLQEIFMVVVLVLSMGAHATSIAFVRKVSWLHSAEDLNFWAMILASLLFFFLGAVSGETPLDYTMNFYLLLAISGFVTLSLGTFLYRTMAVESNTHRLFALWIGGILGAEAISMCLLKDTYLGWRTGVGTLLTLAPFFSGLGRERIHIWASHYISNTRRQGDRVACQLSGFMKTQQGATVKIQIHDLSIAGLGFNSESHVPIAEDVVLSLPFQSVEWSQVSLDCKVVHMQKATSDPAWPFMGGLSFKKLAPLQRTLLIEFLARLSHSNG